MGRELRRREERKNKNKKAVENEEELDTSIKGTTVLKVVSTIVLLLLVVYYVLAVFVTKELDISAKDNENSETSEKEENNESTTSNKILAATIFNQSEESYYVYCYDFTDEDNGVAEAVNASQEKIYRLNTKDSLNSRYVTEGEGNKNATSLEDLKISNPTLLVITGDKITGYYEGRSNIISFLGN